MSKRIHAGLLLLTLLASSQELEAQELRLSDFRTIGVNGVQLAYREYGSGPALVLLHGNGNSGVMWNAVVPELARHFHVIVPDLRGYGRSTNPTRRFSFQDAAQDILSLLDSLRVDTFRGVGNSGGAMVLLHVANMASDRVEAMVLQTGTSYFPEHVRQMARADSPETWTSADLEDMVRREVAMTVEQAREIRGYFHALKDSTDDVNFTPEVLARITTRTLIVHGDRDSYFPVEIALEQYRAFPNSYLWVLPNHDHYVGMPVDVWLDFFSGRWWQRRPRS
jgi:pimeloyl-ACP methyl ester carboxylesterase